MADGGAVDTDGPATLLPVLELFVHSPLFGDDGSQGIGHPLELLFVKVCPITIPLRVFTRAKREREREGERVDNLMIISLEFDGIVQT